jgi:hypothetical protein
MEEFLSSFGFAVVVIAFILVMLMLLSDIFNP